MRKEYTDLKRVKLVATIFSPEHAEDEDWDEIVFEILMPEWEWTRLMEEGCFSLAYDEVIEGYKRYIALVSRVESISIHFEEVKEEI